MRKLSVVFFVLVLAFVLEGCLAASSKYFRSTVAPATAAAYDAYYRSGWNIGGEIADDGKIQFHMFWPFWGTPSPARICVYRDSEFYGVYDLHAHRSPSFSGNNEVYIWIYDYAAAEMTKANYRGAVPGATPVNCGNYLLHDLPMAKYEARVFLKQKWAFSYPPAKRTKAGGRIFFDA